LKGIEGTLLSILIQIRIIFEVIYSNENIPIRIILRQKYSYNNKMNNKQYNKWFAKLNLFDKEEIYKYWEGEIDPVA